MLPSASASAPPNVAPAAVARVPVRTLLGKRAGAVDYAVPPEMETLLLVADHFRAGEVCAVLGISPPELVPVLRLAASRHMAGFQQRVAGFQSLVAETGFMNGTDTAAVESLCFPTLQREMKKDRAIVQQLNAIIGPIGRGTDLWISRTLFYATVLPAARVVYGTPIYLRWLGHIDAHRGGVAPPIVVAC